jgi:hypothetical protein
MQEAGRALIDLALLRRIFVNNDIFHTGCMHLLQVLYEILQTGC